MKLTIITLAGFIFFAPLALQRVQGAEDEAVTAFDGVWKGQSTNFSKGCGRMNYEIEVKDGVITGNARLMSVVVSDSSNDFEVSGKVKADGSTVIRTKGRNAMPGKFTDSEFHGKLTSTGTGRCDYEVVLKRK